MTRDQQLKHFNEICQKLEDLMLKKGSDYANSDRLSNFKIAGTVAGLSPEKNCLSLIATKVARISNLIDRETRNYESLSDSLHDLALYAMLMDMIISEKEITEKEV